MKHAQTAHKLAYISLAVSVVSLLVTILLLTLIEKYLVVYMMICGLLSLAGGFFATVSMRFNKRCSARIRKITKASSIICGVTLTILIIITGFCAFVFAMSNAEGTTVQTTLQVTNKIKSSSRLTYRLSSIVFLLYIALVTALVTVPGKIFIRIYGDKIDAIIEKEMHEEKIADDEALLQKQREDALARRREREEEAERKRRQEEAFEEWKRNHQ